MFKHILVPTDGSDLSRKPSAAPYPSPKAGARITAFFANRNTPSPISAKAP